MIVFFLGGGTIHKSYKRKFNRKFLIIFFLSSIAKERNMCVCVCVCVCNCQSLSDILFIHLLDWSLQLCAQFQYPYFLYNRIYLRFWWIPGVAQVINFLWSYSWYWEVTINLTGGRLNVFFFCFVFWLFTLVLTQVFLSWSRNFGLVSSNVLGYKCVSLSLIVFSVWTGDLCDLCVVGDFVPFGGLVYVWEEDFVYDFSLII